MKRLTPIRDEAPFQQPGHRSRTAKRNMDDIIVWIIIAGFYAPLHYLLPVLILFITGNEPEAQRRNLIRRAVIDSTASMVIAFTIVILMVRQGWMFPAMLVLLLSMGFPFIRIWRHRREIMSETA